MSPEPGDGVVWPGYREMRTSTADRERAVDVLKAAFAEGRLDQTEYTDRVGLVYSSRTYAELGALTADLPVGPLGTLPQAPVMPVPYQQVPYQPVPYQQVPYQPVPYPVSWLPVPPPPPARQTNGMALAAFLFGLGGFVTVGITAPLAIVFGIAAAVRIQQSRESGIALALAGIGLAIANVLFVMNMIWI